MEKVKSFNRVRFLPEILARVRETLALMIVSKGLRTFTERRKVERSDGESWLFDTDAEFYSDLRLPYRGATFEVSASTYGMEIFVYETWTQVSVKAPSRQEISSLFELFEEAAPNCRLPEQKPNDEPSRPRIFIGHGRSLQWRDLKDHLHEHHGYDVEAYEVGARAGHVIRDILEQMLRRSDFALLVLTGEDETNDGQLRARQNVIHELGLFQGRLGFARAIALVEEGTEDFSNLQGVHQIRYAAGKIKETYGEVLATLRREFEIEKNTVDRD